MQLSRSSLLCAGTRNTQQGKAAGGVADAEFSGGRRAGLFFGMQAEQCRPGAAAINPNDKVIKSELQEVEMY